MILFIYFILLRILRTNLVFNNTTARTFYDQKPDILQMGSSKAPALFLREISS